jgi:hypothetical protein
VMPLQGSLSIERMCQLAGVSRAGFYRSLQERAPVEEDMEVRSERRGKRLGCFRHKNRSTKRGHFYFGKEGDISILV